MEIGRRKVAISDTFPGWSDFLIGTEITTDAYCQELYAGEAVTLPSGIHPDSRDEYLSATTNEMSEKEMVKTTSKITLYLRISSGIFAFFTLAAALFFMSALSGVSILWFNPKMSWYLFALCIVFSLEVIWGMIILLNTVKSKSSKKKTAWTK